MTRTLAQKERHRQAMAIYRKRYPARVKAAKQKWLLTHPDYQQRRNRSPEMKARYKAWNAKHPHRNDRFRHGGLRLIVLERDGWQCCLCGMTNAVHKATYGESITVDHKQGGGRYAEQKDHRLENMWTLCLKCHGSKDGKLSWSKVKAKRVTNPRRAHG